MSRNFRKKLSNRNLKNRIHSRNGVVLGPFLPKESETVKSARENASLIMSIHMYRVRIFSFLKNCQKLIESDTVHVD